MLVIAWELFFGSIEKENNIRRIRPELVEFLASIYNHNFDRSRSAVRQNLASAVGIHDVSARVGSLNHRAVIIKRQRIREIAQPIKDEPAKDCTRRSGRQHNRMYKKSISALQGSV